MLLTKLKFLFLVLYILATFFSGLLVGVYLSDQEFQNQAIERGYANHNDITGVWQWK